MHDGAALFKETFSYGIWHASHGIMGHTSGRGGTDTEHPARLGFLAATCIARARIRGPDAVRLGRHQGRGRPDGA